MATVNAADVYGSPSAAGVFLGGNQPSVSGPNQSSVTGNAQAGSQQVMGGKQPAFTWVSFIAALVILRIAIDAQNKG